MRAKRWLRAGGELATLTCFGFLGKTLLEIDPSHLATLSIDSFLTVLLLGSFVYALLLLAVASGFADLARTSGHAHGTIADALVIWGKANLAKYLPGNVLHFAGRQMLGARRGWPQAAIAAASLLEIILQLMVPLTIALLLLLRFGHLAMLEGLEGGALHVVAALVLVAMTALAALACLPRLMHLLPLWVREAVAKVEGAEPARLWCAFGWYLVFFFGIALLACAVDVVVIGDIVVDRLPIVAAAMLVAWVVGFVLPGAPGGLGVREGTFIALAGAFLPADALVITALAMRFVALTGEALFFFLAVATDRLAARPATLPLVRPAAGRAGPTSSRR